MTGNFEVDDQDVQDIVKAIRIIQVTPHKSKDLGAFKERLENIKERILKVEVNEF